ncbi:MAG: GyrI-like domain-containing protein [Rhizobiaceae bacterium]
MEIEIVEDPFRIELHGFFGDVVNGDYAAAGIPLLNAMWNEIGEEKLAHKGINYWAYLAADRVFVGVELEPDSGDSKLELFPLELSKYATYRHIGPYSELGGTHQAIHAEIEKRGMSATRPTVEIYGHWQEDESKLITDVLIPLGSE